jgi:hypothetical protein
VRAKNCRWEGDATELKIGSALPAGKPLRLAAGLAEIEFAIGAKVIVQSPATLQLVSANSMRLDRGKATVEIKDPRARGFKILTPEASFVDQGTEFGVEVAPGGGSKIHVFQGMVDVDRGAAEGRPALPTQRLLANIGARMESGAKGMLLVEDTGECFVRSMDDADRDRHVIAYWRFEDRPVGALLPVTGRNSRPIRATIDSSFNGNDLYVYSDEEQPAFTGDVPSPSVPQTGSLNRSCLVSWRPGDLRWSPNVYTHSEFSHAAPLDIQEITPARWTIEVSVKAAKLTDKAQTFLVRDATFTQRPVRERPRLVFQINAKARFAVSFFDIANRLHEAVAQDLAVAANHWYHAAAVSDGRILRLYVDALDGRGYVLRASQDLPATGSTALGKGANDAEWAIGRGGINERSNQVEAQFYGWIDELRISDVARGPSEFLFAPAPAATKATKATEE